MSLPPSPFSNPLMGEKDLDPGRWRSHFEKVDIDVPIALNATATGSITTVDLPFWLTRVTHQIVGAWYDWQTTGLMQDGGYSVRWSDPRTTYTHGSPDAWICPDAIWGSVRDGHQLLLPKPMFYPGRNDHTFDIRNDVARILTPEAETFRVQIQLHGMVDHGAAKREPK